LAILYDIWPVNGKGLFLEHCSYKQLLTVTDSSTNVTEIFETLARSRNLHL